MTTRISHVERSDTGSDHTVGEGRTGVTLYINSKPIEFKMVPQCRVCQAHDRDQIEHGLMVGYGYQAIAKGLPEDSELWRSRGGDEEFSLAQVCRLIGDHSRRGHARGDLAVTRAIQEEWAKKSGIDIEAATTSIVTEFGLLNEVMRRAWQNMIETGTPPTLNQGLRAAETMLTYRDIASDVDANVFREGGEAMFRVLRTMFDDDVVQQIFLKMQEDPTIQSAFLALQADNN